jgi:hypothetical protein
MRDEQLCLAKAAAHAAAPFHEGVAAAQFSIRSTHAGAAPNCAAPAIPPGLCAARAVHMLLAELLLSNR